MSNLENVTSLLIKNYPMLTSTISAKEMEVKEEWTQLKAKASKSRENLLVSYDDLRQFLTDYSYLMNWIETMMNLISKENYTNNVIEIQALLKSHQELRSQIVDRGGTFKTLKMLGEELIKNGHKASTEIKFKLEKINAAGQYLEKTWIARKQQLEQWIQVQLFFQKQNENVIGDKSVSRSDDMLMKKLFVHQLNATENCCLLGHLAALKINSAPVYPRLTSIICTIGPASREVDILVQMIKAGMNIVRLNFSHGPYKHHAETMKNARKAIMIMAEQEGLLSYPVAIALDTKGPEIRTGLLEGGPFTEVEMIKGEMVKVTTDDAYIEKCSAKVIHVDYKNITKVVTPGSQIYVDDGLISLVVKNIGDNFIDCEIENGGMLGSKKGCNLPVDLPVVSEKDKQDLLFGIEQDVDMVFASFIRNAKDVKEIRDILGDKGKHIKIISKIGNHEGVKKINEIIECSDGIMVSREDLGIEIPTEKLFLLQKMIIAKCNIAGKPVICATQMLESMVKKPHPTEAESCDVANAVLDGADCVMLSGETAIGDYPVRAVQVMHSICCEAEAAILDKNFFKDITLKTFFPTDFTLSIVIAAVNAAMKSLAAAIVVLTTTGRTAHMISKYRPRCPIIAVSRMGLTTRQAHLYRGIVPIHFAAERLPEWKQDVDSRVQYAVNFARKRNYLKSGDNLVIVTGWQQGTGASTIRIITIH